MLGRQTIAADNSDDEAEERGLAALQRQGSSVGRTKTTNRAVNELVSLGQRATSENRLMDAVQHYTEALAEPQVNLLAARASLTGRLQLHQAVLHDGEMIIKTMPDRHQGHAICGSALFCLRQWAPAVRACARRSSSVGGPGACQLA